MRYLVPALVACHAKVERSIWSEQYKIPAFGAGEQYDESRSQTLSSYCWREHIPARGGVLVVANHLADIDPAALGLACTPRPAQYLAMARHFTHQPLAMLLFSLGAFPVQAGQPDTRALRHARNQLEAGRLVVIFPEGAPTWGPEMSEFRQGVGHLALTPGVTVVPAALWGTHRVLRGWRPVGRGPGARRVRAARAGVGRGHPA